MDGRDMCVMQFELHISPEFAGQERSKVAAARMLASAVRGLYCRQPWWHGSAGLHGDAAGAPCTATLQKSSMLPHVACLAFCSPSATPTSLRRGCRASGTGEPRVAIGRAAWDAGTTQLYLPARTVLACACGSDRGLCPRCLCVQGAAGQREQRRVAHPAPAGGDHEQVRVVCLLVWGWTQVLWLGCLAALLGCWMHRLKPSSSTTGLGLPNLHWVRADNPRRRPAGFQNRRLTTSLAPHSG